ncbi:MAG TPA: hypothetical protein VGX16_04210 [Solirubrobacteraceae bacterium]|nr:hypothetical protein [Solirubrobacteraceae bacterium]
MLAALLCAGALATAPARATPTLSWSGPRAADPYGLPTGIACVSTSLCVEIDASGYALTSTNPSSPEAHWSATQIDPGHQLRAISCPGENLCIALDEAGAALTNTTPTNPGSGWQTRAIDPSGSAPLALSCSSPTLCLALDAGGEALASEDPGGPAPTWSSTEIDPGHEPRALSCVSPTLCLALDAGGGALASEDPAAPTPSWAASLPETSPFAQGSIACLSERFCLALDVLGRVLTASLPATPKVQPVQSPPPNLPLPHPTIAGVPAVGERLHCEPGVPTTSTATLAYAWVRDGARIAGAGSSSYHVSSADATHHLRCEVTASDAMGSQVGASAYVAIPAQGVPVAVGETTVDLVRVSGARVSVSLTCSPRAAGECAIALRLSVVETLQGRRLLAISAARGHGGRHGGSSASSHARRLRLSLGAANLRLRPAQRSTVTIALNATGRALLAHERHMTARLSISGTVIGALAASLRDGPVTFANPSRISSHKKTPHRK